MNSNLKININEKVRVKLTDYGRKILEENHNDLWKKSTKTYPYIQPPEDADGYSEWQLWALMAELGKHIRFGNSVQPFETEIEIVLPKPYLLGCGI